MKKAFLKGKKVILRPLVLKDAQGPYSEWFNDELVCKQNSHHVYPFSFRDAEDYIESVRKNKTILALAIESIREKLHIGNITLKNIDQFSKTAEYAIIIGNPKFWGKGYGEEASRLIIEHGFKALGLRRIYAGTFVYNSGMRKLAARLGMKEEGVRRKAIFKDGEFLDVIEFGLLVEEYKA